MEALAILLYKPVEFGITVAIVGFSIVFASLALLVIVFIRLPKLINRFVNRSRVKKNRNADVAKKDEKQDEFYLEGNVTAAISMALHLYFNELHDEESNVVTIKKVKKAYSPWSSKIYSVNQNWPR